MELVQSPHSLFCFPVSKSLDIVMRTEMHTTHTPLPLFFFFFFHSVAMWGFSTSSE
jgi:hypothetical protein